MHLRLSWATFGDHRFALVFMYSGKRRSRARAMQANGTPHHVCHLAKMSRMVQGADAQEGMCHQHCLLCRWV